MRLGFSKLLGTLSGGKICIYLLRIHYKQRSEKDLFDDDYMIFSDFLYKGICCGCSFELHRQVNAIQMSTYNICLHIEVKKKYTGYNLNSTEFLDCALIGVCAVIRSNTVDLDRRMSMLLIFPCNDDGDEFRLNDASTQEGHLHQNVIHKWVKVMYHVKKIHNFKICTKSTINFTVKIEFSFYLISLCISKLLAPLQTV